MALVEVIESWAKVNAEQTQENGIALGLVISTTIASKGYTVLYDIATAPIESLSATGIPAIGAAYSAGYPTVLAVSKRVVPLGPFLHEVTVEYSGGKSPILFPYERSWQDASSMEQITEDADGDLIVNTVGDPVIAQKDFSDPVYVVTRNEAAEPLSTIKAYSNTVNADTFKTFTAGMCRMLPITCVRQVDGTSYYWKVTYRIQCRAFGALWKYRYPNKGPRYLPSVGAAPVPAADLGLSEVLLAANGTRLAPGASPVFNTVEVYPTTTFATLGLA